MLKTNLLGVAKPSSLRELRIHIPRSNQQQGSVCIPNKQTCTLHIYIHIYVIYMLAMQSSRQERQHFHKHSTSGLILFPFLPDQLKILFVEKIHKYTHAHIYMQIHNVGPYGSWPQALSLPSSCPWTLVLLSCQHLDMCLLKAWAPLQCLELRSPSPSCMHGGTSLSCLRHAADGLGSPGFTVIQRHRQMSLRQLLQTNSMTSVHLQDHMISPEKGSDILVSLVAVLDPLVSSISGSGLCLTQ